MSEKNNSTERACKILKALKGRTLSGVSNKELATSLGESPVNISRSLAVLIKERFVVKNEETKRFSLGQQFLNIASAHQTELANQMNLVAQLQQSTQAGGFV